ncbi:lysophospholipid acyltransferase family protein [Elioraea sp.]|uniref:lysophospholipid acyltransferase family protein n=1 Tax=Elioraea sp. TaxID=2185103 RepID=UPI00307E0B49
MTILRSLLFNFLFFAFTAAAALACLPLVPLLDRAGRLAILAWWAERVLGLLRLTVGIRLRVTGAEHLPAAGPALIAAKHQSAFDTIVWLALLPRPAYVLKRELLWIPLYGWYARAAGMIGVDRGAGPTAIRHLMRAGAEALAEGRQIVIFPEGTRTAPGTRRPYQPGIAALYARSGLPVIPVATDSGLFWGRRAFRKRAGTITVAVLPPIPPGLARAEMLARLETAIESETDRLLASAPPSA